MTLTWNHLIIKRERIPTIVHRQLVSLSVQVSFVWECVCMWLWKWATKRRFSRFSFPVHGLSVMVPELNRRMRSRERNEGEGWVGERRTSEQQRAAGAIIPPNAPCLSHVCSGSLVSGRLSALMQKVTWVIKCSSQGWGDSSGCLSSVATLGYRPLRAAAAATFFCRWISRARPTVSLVVMYYVTGSVLSGQ